MHTQLPEVITKHFNITEGGKEFHLRCKRCDKEYKVAKPAQGKSFNNLVLRNITKHTESHPLPQEQAKVLPFVRKEVPSSPEITLEEPAFPHTYEVVIVGGMVTTNRIEPVHVFKEPRVEKVGEAGWMVTLHAANREHAEVMAKGIIGKMMPQNKRRNWRDRLRERMS